MRVQRLTTFTKTVAARPNALRVVLLWELRRVAANRTNWLLPIAIVLLFALVAASQQNAHQLPLRVQLNATQSSPVYYYL